MVDEKKRILITGASGFIGGFLVDEALRRGYDVWAGIRSGSSRERLRDERLHFIDLRYDDKNKLSEQLCEVVSVLGPWHYIIHNAGITKALNKADFYKVNAHYTGILIESLVEAGCIPEKFLLMSSLSSYGPVNEGSFKHIGHDDKQQPNTAYGKSKFEAEQFVKTQSYFPYVILLPTGVYGPEDKDYFIEIKSVRSGFDLKVGMKPQKISFIYVKDLAVASFLALENEISDGKSYFVSDGDVYTDTEFAGLVRKILNKRFVVNVRVPIWICYMACVLSEFVGRITRKAMTLNTDKYKILKQRNWICDTDLICKELGFMPQYDLDKGLREAIYYYREKKLL